MKPLELADKNLLNRPFKPHNVVNVVLGTALLWIGWFGFNGGSALGANLRAVSACISTHLAACAGGVTGTLLEYIAAFRKGTDSGRFSIIGFCNGAVAGLVAITPAAGYVSLTFPLRTLKTALTEQVPYWSAPIIGIAGSFFVALFQGISESYFDTNEIFVVHGVAGWVGMLLTAGFARYVNPFSRAWTGCVPLFGHSNRCRLVDHTQQSKPKCKNLANIVIGPILRP